MMIWNGLLLLAELWLLGCLVLLLHRVSARLGLTPLVIFLGSMAILIQFRAVNWITVPVGSLGFQFDANLFLPVMLMGLLVIYIINGTIQTRMAFIGIFLSTVLVLITQPLLVLHLELGAQGNPLSQVLSYPPRTLIAILVVLAIDLVLLIVIYQFVSNLRGRYPSRLAAGLALTATLMADGLIFPLIEHYDALTWPYVASLTGGILAKGISGALLWPLVSFYIFRVAKRIPASIAATPRPTLDIFLFSAQLEARTRDAYNLVRIISEINQLIVRAEDPDTLLNRACHLLAEGRGYALAWVGMVTEAGDIVPAAKAGPATPYLEAITIRVGDPNYGSGPTGLALRSRDTVLVNDISRDPNFTPWRVAALANHLHSLACLPMRYGNHILGLLNVYSTQAYFFEQLEETNLLQELADDLGYALSSLEARRQQSMLHTAAETMTDGLLIIELDGKIQYANPAFGDLLGIQLDQLIGKNIIEISPQEQVDKLYDEYIPALIGTGQTSFRMQFPRQSGQLIQLSIQTSAVHGAQGQPTHIVANVRDITQRLRYEDQLLTLNRLTGDLVQIYNPQQLNRAILKACQQLLQAQASAIHFLDPYQDGLADVVVENMPERYDAEIRSIFRRIHKPGRQNFAHLLCVEDLEANAGTEIPLRAMAQFGLRAAMLLPIQFQERLLGVVALYYDRPHKFSEEERQLAQTVMHTLAITLQNASLYQSEYDQRRLAEALAQATLATNKSLDLDVVLDRILDQMVKVMPCQVINLRLIDGDEAPMVRCRQTTPSDPGNPLGVVERLSLATPTLHTMLETGQPLLISNTHEFQGWTRVPESTWIQSYLGTPLISGGKTLGFLSLYSSDLGFFKEETIQPLAAFAAAASTAIQNALLYQDLQRHTQVLEDRVRERTAELRTAKEGIEAILASVPDAVFVLDENDQLLDMNQAGETLLGQAKVAEINLFNPDFLKYLQAELRPSEKTILEVNARSYQALASPLPLQPKKAGFVVVFRDVTRLRELDQMKTRFVSDVSHELRTPLTNMTIYLDLLSSVKDASKQAGYLATLHRETNRLTELIENLLTISRLEAGRVQLTLQAVDINRLTCDLAQDRVPMAASRGLTLEYCDDPDLPRGWADQRLLTQVISNLLTNALNYTPPDGKIWVKTGLQVVNQCSWLAVSVTDTGAGIPQEEVGLLFERFYRGSASRLTGAPGTGLGLAISKEIMERMGGRITLESEPGKGSTFSVWLRAVL